MIVYCRPRREQWAAGGPHATLGHFYAQPILIPRGTRKTSNGGNLFRLSIIGQSARKTGNNAGSRSMAVDEDLAERIRAVLGGTGALREVRMFGGLCFMLNGNMLVGTSKRGLLVRVGKDQHSDALARPGAKPMEMAGRSMKGYIFVDPVPRDEQALRDWLELAVAFVKTLPPKLPKSKSGRTKTNKKP
jgi:TfoX/Sxy family transcriptional regulator of competence genes